MLLVALDLDPVNSLGTILFLGDGRQMKDYLSKLSPLSLYVFPA
jgi:hypothetical protein